MAKTAKKKPDPAAAKALKELQVQAAAACKMAEKQLREAKDFLRKVSAVKPDAPDLDVKTAELKDMTRKRALVFDTLRQIIDKYNQTTDGIIRSIGR